MILQKAYKEDYELSKSVVCFPYTLTDEYDTLANLQRVDVCFLFFIFAEFEY